MENKKAELLERIENMREDYDSKIEELRPSWDYYTSELSDIIDECVDELDSNCDILSKLDELEEKLYGELDEELLQEIEDALYNIDNEIYDLELDSEKVIEAICDYFIYYDDAWEYLKNTGQTDFEDAFNYGAMDICAIATYYMMREYGAY